MSFAEMGYWLSAVAEHNEAVRTAVKAAEGQT